VLAQVLTGRWRNAQRCGEMWCRMHPLSLNGAQHIKGGWSTMWDTGHKPTRVPSDYPYTRAQRRRDYHP